MHEFGGFLWQILIGAKLTISVAIGALIVGLIMALVGAVGSLSKNKAIVVFTTSIISVIRGLPELLVLFVLYFGGTIFLTKIFGRYVEVNALTAGIFALSIIFAAYAAETLRGAFLSIPSGQKQAAQALGLSAQQIFFRITLPQAWRHALPGLGNLWLTLLKDTSLVSLLGLADLMNKTQTAANRTHQAFTFYLIAALLYLVMTSGSQIVMYFLQRRVNLI